MDGYRGRSGPSLLFRVAFARAEPPWFDTGGVVSDRGGRGGQPMGGPVTSTVFELAWMLAGSSVVSLADTNATTWP